MSDFKSVEPIYQAALSPSDENLSITILETIQAEPPNNADNPSLFWTDHAPIITAIGEEFSPSNADIFVTSVARGQIVDFSQEDFSEIFEFSKTAVEGQPFSFIGELARNFNTRIFHKTAGPPESSPYNSGEFRIRFYFENVEWQQTRTYRFGGTRIRHGTAIRPTRYIFYSIYRRIV
ncbi:MAG: hypothetical protein FWG65_12330 [Turicibacter sp.]|nr:hypothetical protein [Turicibacter sp.]